MSSEGFLFSTVHGGIKGPRYIFLEKSGTAYLFLPFIEVLSYATLRSAYFPKGLRRSILRSTTKDEPEDPLLAGRYVARVSHRIPQIDGSRRPRSASVSFRLSHFSLFVTKFAGKFKGQETGYRRQNSSIEYPVSSIKYRGSSDF